MWGRGLKHQEQPRSSSRRASPPMWGRGLKHLGLVVQTLGDAVAPHVGAWIETQRQQKSKEQDYSRPPCGGVD